MPAGNDAANAARALADSVGAGGSGADEMIKASRARYRGDLGKSQLLNASKEELDLEAVAKTAGVKTVLSATRRGDFVVFVADEDGDVHKGVFDYADLGKKAKAEPKADEEPAPKRKVSRKKSSDDSE